MKDHTASPDGRTQLEYLTKGRKRFEGSPGSMPNTFRMASTRPRTYTPQAHTLARKNIRPMLPPNSGPSERLIMSDGGLVKARLSNQSK